MSFSHIIGQDKAIGLLRQAMARDQIPHAYLFTGIRGVGKTITARAMAMALNCPVGSLRDGCGRCAACRQIMGGNHPDLIHVQPEGNTLKIHQIRELNHSLAFAPVSALYRITIVQQAETMSQEAANAFLKTLEEPPPRNILILQAVEPANLLPTVVSRCQRVRFQPLRREDIAARLLEEGRADAEVARIVAGIAGGSLGKAEKIMAGSFLEKRQGWLLKLIELPGSRVEKVFLTATDYAKEDARQQLEQSEDSQPGLQDILSVWESWYRDLMVIKIKAVESLLINLDFSRQLKKAAERFSVVRLMDCIFMIDNARRDLFDNRNAGLVMAHLVLGLWKSCGGR